ncbi:hypothetical protein SNEBB_005839 [Seison nebaliae]|nr:hypothetical protein SNEBB_005839 [Seison nebaliae]
MHIKMKQIIDDIYSKVKIGTTRAELDRNFPDIPLHEMTFTDIPEVLPPSFWCDEQPCEQKLFHNFTGIPSNVAYEVYAFHLQISSNERKIQHLNAGYNDLYSPNDIYMRTVPRLNEFSHLFLTLDYQVETEEQEILFMGKTTDLLYKLAKTETLLSIDDFNSRRYYSASSHFTVQDRREEGHSFTIIKSLDGSRWYYISNSNVIKIDDLKTVLEGKRYEHTLSAIVIESFWHEKISYREDMQNLIPLIKPILLSDYNRRRKILETDPNTPRSTPFKFGRI